MAAIKIDFRSVIGRMAKELAQDAREAVHVALQTNEFQNRTGNLEDSYGAAVYYEGRMVEGTQYTLTPTAISSKKWKGKEMRGSEEIIRYLRTYKPRTQGLSMIVVAAMPYGEILEKGQGNLYHKYKVITGANDFMRQLARKWEGRFGRKAKGIRVNVTPITG